jgi:CRISPR system Cascade subunit CasB
VSKRTYGLPEGARGVFAKWWHGLTSETASGQARADRAVLRRAGSLTAVACTAAYQRVYAEMLAGCDPADRWPSYKQERIAALVALAAHLKPSASTSLPQTSLPQAMGPRGDGTERNPVSELRFLRLLDAPDIEALFTGLRRVLPLVEHKVDPFSMADDIFAWGDRVKKDWAYSYAWPKKASG